MSDAAQATAGFPLTLDAFRQLPVRFKMAAAIGLAVAISLIVGTWLWAKQPEYTVLFSNLSDKDGGEIVTALQQQNIPYRFSDTGSAILIPAAQVHDVRLKLASQGLPKGGLVGFEVMENQKLGASQFLEQINYQRALEGELARTISTIGSVRGARVHLAIPKQTSFLRDEQKPTASVLLNLQPGRSLEGVQIAGIVHLVSSSVPELNPVNVSLIDQEGNLISQKNDPLHTSGLDPSQIKYVRQLEENYVKRIEAIIGPIVGAGNVKAQVTADVDFSQIETVAENYRPNPNPDTAIRSQQTNESGTTNPPALGVPGALTNQPPAPATAPITTPAVPAAPAATTTTTAGNTTTSNAPINFTKNATINYEVDKTVRHTKGVPGVVRRLSVAVLVNQKKDPAKPKPLPLSDNEIKQITALAREAVGFSQERGDSLNVANAPFTPDDRLLPETPLWKDPFVIDTVKETARYIALIVVAWLVWTKLLQPLFRKLAEIPKPAHVEEESEEEGGEGTEHGHHHSFEHKVAQAKELAKQDPKMVANMIKEWIGGEPR